MSIQNGNIEEFLTVAEVAELLKLNQQTVRNWIDQGSLPAHRVGRRVRIRRSDLDRMLEEGYTARAAAMTVEPGEPGEPAEPGPSGEDFWGGELADPWDGAAREPSVK
jgi:excisionase family DNA binding protein